MGGRPSDNRFLPDVWDFGSAYGGSRAFDTGDCRVRDGDRHFESTEGEEVEKGLKTDFPAVPSAEPPRYTLNSTTLEPISVIAQ